MLLPDALQPWRPWLDWFAPALAPEIGQMLRRLSPLLGPLHGTRQAGPPEPDGLDDLRRRGSYDRLLSSEWLLAEDLPDEFLRRAASGEHLFLAPRPRARRAEMLIIALFDAGPLQLGAPRLAHLALWILLARRAAEAGGELRWGALQGPCALRDAATPADLRRLLKARGYGIVQPWTAWQTFLAEAAPRVGELWHIGATGPDGGTDGPQPSHLVTVRPAVAEDALDIAIAERHRRRTAALPLPPAAAAMRLLKGNFLDVAAPQAHSTTTQAFAITRPPVLAPGGHLVAVPLLGQPGFHVFRIPQVEGKSARSKPQQLPKGAEPLTLAFHGKTLGALLSHPTHLLFWQMGLQPIPLPPLEQFQASVGRANWLASAWQRTGLRNRFFVLDEARRLICWESEDKAPVQHKRPAKYRVVAEDVLGFVLTTTGGVVYGKRENGPAVICVEAHDGQLKRRYLLQDVADAAAIQFGGVSDWNGNFRGCAVASPRQADGTQAWTIFHPQPNHRTDPFRIEQFVLPAQPHVIGLVPRPTLQEYSMAILSPNGRSVVLFGDRNARKHIYQSPSRVLKVAADSTSGMIALLTEERQLIVFSTLDRTLRLFVHSKVSGDDPA
jgi:hypothetical protein